MNVLVSSLLFLTLLHSSYCVPLRLQKRAAFYIANETACVVDNIVYSNGDPIPTDDPCEACKCRPPGFACVLKECQVKPGCRAVRRIGHCCPDYVCGCEHNGRMYRDGDEIRDSQNPCYTCHCQGSSIACAFEDCFFRVDCAPEYIPGECCPRYTNCTAPKTPFEEGNPRDEDVSTDATIVPNSVIVPGVSYVEDTTDAEIPDTTVIGILVETKEPELFNLNPEIVILDKIADDESSESEELQDENIPKGINPIIISDSETTPLVEIASDKIVELKVNEEMVESLFGTEQTVPHHEIFTPETVLDITEPVKIELFSEVSSQPEAPLVITNIDVEPEEPSNNLELKGLSSEYGKSLKFDDKVEQENKTEPKEESQAEPKEESQAEPKEESQSQTEDSQTQPKEESQTQPKEESQTEQSQKLLFVKDSLNETLTTEKIPGEIVSPTTVKVSTANEKTDLTSNSDSTEKISLYVERDSLKTESVESVTTVIEVKDKTTPAITEKSDLTATPTVPEPLFKFNIEKIDEEKSTVLPDVESIKNDKTDSTTKTESAGLELSSNSSSSEQPETTTPSKGEDKTTLILID